MTEKVFRETLMELARNKAYEYESRYHGCSQAVLLAVQQVLEMNDDTVLKAAGPLCAGLGSGKTCGALTGGCVALGLKHGRSNIKEGLEGLLPGMAIVQRLVNRFEDEFGATACQEISGIDWLNPESVFQALGNKELMEKCANIAGKTAAMVVGLMAE